MSIFFNSWDEVFRVLITIIFAYPGLIILLRLYGKRSLSKMNMFDFIITIALGSVFASVVLLKNVTIADGLISFMLLLTAQYVITFISLRSEFFKHIIRAEPTLVFHNGEFLEDDMFAVRVNKQEVLSEVRQKGIACLDDVYAVVLETNGMMSVIRKKENINTPTLRGLSNYEI